MSQNLTAKISLGSPRTGGAENAVVMRVVRSAEKPSGKLSPGKTAIGRNDRRFQTVTSSWPLLAAIRALSPEITGLEETLAMVAASSLGKTLHIMIVSSLEPAA